jgi:hypothetical protein
MTAKLQLNVRVSQTTRRQLDELVEQYGTQATALAVAIDRMHRAESLEKEEIMSTVEITVNGKIHRFVFDPQTDAPADGPTLVGVRYENSDDVHQLAPTQHAEEAAWKIAAEEFGL